MARATRNLTRLMFETLKQFLVDNTDVEAKNIYAKYPDVLFVKKDDGPNTGPVNELILPAIGMTYWKNPSINRNRIQGYTKIFPQASGRVVEFEPSGEQSYPIELHIFARTRNQVEEIANDIIQWLIQDENFTLIGDVANDWCSIKPCYTKDYNGEHNPYHHSVLVDIMGTVYKESSGYMVSNVFVTIQPGMGINETGTVGSVEIEYTVDGIVEMNDLSSTDPELSEGIFNLTEYN